MSFKRRLGFTLAELLVVIAIIGDMYLDDCRCQGSYFHQAGNNAVATAWIDGYTCPSDTRREPCFTVGSYNFEGSTKHNYVANFGNTTRYATDLSDQIHMGAPFYELQCSGGVVSKGDVRRFRDIRDGTSNTLLASETIQTKGTDCRGMIWYGVG